MDDDTGPVDAFRPGGVGPRPASAWTALRRDADLVVVVAAGGGIGSLGRYGIATWIPTRAGDYPWSTFLVNVSGCVLIGVLIVFVSEVWRSGRYRRPFLGVGVLGGFTTYSTMMLDLRTLARDGDWLMADIYLVGTLLAGLAGVWIGVLGTRMLAGQPPRRHGQRGS